ncbi:nucleotidyltransferase family protein [Uliginosibacterium sp. H1]|uniref:nucleotidyltransferase family protein n=1 Tax=Uliginosibacterium sp. H1 TaxID=3114757 RepID=UPI002E187BDE|nr:nucleotidyltransferase family protein [Uliginosibacterium sp. H1]
MKPSEALRLHRDEVMALARAHHVLSLRVFGSVARGEDREDSDLDLIADFEEGATLFNAFALQDVLEVLLTHRVEIATQDGLHPEIRERVLREARPV